MENGKWHKKFEEISVWIKTRELCKEVYSATKQKPFCFAKGNAGEVRAQLYVAENQSYIPFSNAQLLRNQAEVISKQLSAWIQSMQSLDFKQGPRFHKEESKADKFHIEGKKWLEEHVKKINEGRGINHPV